MGESGFVIHNIWGEYHLVEAMSRMIELLAVVLIVGAVFWNTGLYAYRKLISREDADFIFVQYRKSLGKSLLLGLEILVAADVVRTVALEPTMDNVISLGILVMVRTFLSWSLSVEMEGRWPWQGKK